MSEKTKKSVTAGKKPVSEARRRANIENSKRSTGPRAAGKNISRYNRLIHGMRAESILPGETEMYETLLDIHIDELGAETPLARMYIERAVKASLKILRGDRVECALASGLMTAAAAGNAERDAAEFERLKTQLAVDPAGSVRQLRKSVAGCLWIQERWLLIQERCDKHHNVLPSQRTLSLNLIGKQMSDIYSDDSEATRWVIAHLGTLLGGQKDVDFQQVIINAGMPRAAMGRNELEARARAVIRSLPDAPQAWVLLSGYIAEELARLKEHIALVTDVAEQKRACDVRAAEIALNAEGKQLQGYVTTQRQAYDSALRRHEWLHNPRRPGPRRGPDSGFRSGSNSDFEPDEGLTGTERSAVVTADAEAAVGLEATCSDCGPRVEATPESPPLTEVLGADGPAEELGQGCPMMEPGDESFFTTEPNSSDEPAMKPADESFFTTEPNLSAEPPITLANESFFTTEPNSSDEPLNELAGEFPAMNLIGPGAMTREQPADYGAAMDAANLERLDPRLEAIAEKVRQQVRESMLARLRERNARINAELDAKEARERAESAASLKSEFGRRMFTPEPKDASNPDAPRAPPGGGAPAG